MSRSTSLVAAVWRSLQGRLGRLRRDRVVASVLARHPTLTEALAAAEATSGATGAEIWDYVALYVTIRRLRPHAVLECGTGRSTFVIAQALADLRQEDGTRPATRFVSMEHDETWLAHAQRALFPRLEGAVDLVCSPSDTYRHSFLSGTCYREIPNHPYDFVFVDGPTPTIDGQRTCNIDLIRLVERSDHPITALVDSRTHTVLAFALAFGPDKVSFYRAWNLGRVNAVSRADLKLLDKRRMFAGVLERLVPIRYGSPV